MGNFAISQNPTNRFVFRPPEKVKYKKKDVSFLDKEMGLEGLPYVFLPAKRPTKKTLVYSHGNACDLTNVRLHLKRIKGFIPNINIIGYDYIGYGLAKKLGIANEGNTYNSIEAILYFCEKKLKLKKSDIWLYGESLGSGPTCEMAAKYEFGGIILQSAFKSTVKVVWDSPTSFNMISDRTVDLFKNHTKIPKVKSPVMLLHGNSDMVVDVRHGRLLWKLVPKKFQYRSFFVDKANHSSFMRVFTYVRFCSEIKEFMKIPGQNLFPKKKKKGDLKDLLLGEDSL